NNWTIKTAAGGATLYTSATAPSTSQVNAIDYSQAAGGVPAGYQMSYVNCNANGIRTTYDVRWNVTSPGLTGEVSNLTRMVTVGAIFKQINDIHVRSAAEDTKLDLQQEAREVMDQFTRDLHTAGFPNQAMYDPTLLTTATWYNSNTVALRLVKITPTFIQFEGDVDGTGTVSSVIYRYVATSTESVNCPCLARSQAAKT